MYSLMIISFNVRKNKKYKGIINISPYKDDTLFGIC